jgi:hypothetical protein
MARNRKHTEISGVMEYATITDAPPASEIGASIIYVQDTKAHYKTNGTEWIGEGYSDSIADRPSAALFGKGTWQVGSTIYKSNGLNWSTDSNKIIPVQLSKWRKALTNQQLGVSNAKILFLGDSTEMGSLATGGATLNRPLTISDAVARSFVRDGISANVASTIGTSSYTAIADMLAYDARWTAGAGWTIYVPSSTYGIGNRFSNTTTDSALNFTPLDANGVAMQFDKIDVLYEAHSSYANFTIGVDGGAAAFTSTQAGAGATLRATATVALAAHTVNIAKVLADAAKTLNIYGILCYNSAIKEVVCYCGGRSGGAIHQLSNKGGIADWMSSITEITLLAPDLSIINCTINDAALSTNIETYKTKLQALITHCLQYGSVILRPGNPISGYNITPYVQANYELAVTNNLPIIDIHERFVDYTTANALGYMADTLHPIKYGYQDIANNVYDVIKPQ